MRLPAVSAVGRPLLRRRCGLAASNRGYPLTRAGLFGLLLEVENPVCPLHWNALMEIGIIGGGVVGQSLGAGLIKLGHHVTIGIRAVTPDELAKDRDQTVPLADWVAATGGRVATMGEAAESAELVICAAHGPSAIAALTLAGAENLAGKVVIDATNHLDFSQGMPPALLPRFSGHTSLGEQIQAAFPEARLVKGFNTVGAAMLANPRLLGGEHDLFIAGNDADAKAEVTALAQSLGWSKVVDMGDIKAARATETMVLVWLQIMAATGSGLHNFHLVKG